MIRTYEVTDLEDVIEVWYKSNAIAHPFMNDKFIQKEEKNIREIYIPNTKTWVYLNEQKLDGFISMIGNEVGAIFVMPEKQGLGIGKSLMDHVSKLHDDLEVEVFKDNTIGRAFYDKYGFQLIKEHLHEETGRQLLKLKFSKP